MKLKDKLEFTNEGFIKSPPIGSFTNSDYDGIFYYKDNFGNGEEKIIFPYSTYFNDSTGEKILVKDIQYLITRKIDEYKDRLENDIKEIQRLTSLKKLLKVTKNKIKKLEALLKLK